MVLQPPPQTFLFPFGNKPFSRSKPLFWHPETSVWPPSQNVCFFLWKQTFLPRVSLFPRPPPPPQASQSPGLETNVFPSKTKVVNFSWKHADRVHTPHESNRSWLALQVESFDFSCKRYAVQLLPAPWLDADWQSWLHKHKHFTSWHHARHTMSICTLPVVEVHDISASKPHQREAEGVPMIVKLRRRLRTSKHRSLQNSKSLHVFSVLLQSSQNMGKKSGGENLRMPPVLSLCFKQATRKQAWWG